jgi:lysophospholipase L1-like esterase
MLQVARIALAPLLLWQGARVRRQALRLPEAEGQRAGVAGDGALVLRLLIVGDSSGAGVGAASQDDALAGHLSRALARRLGGMVRWQVLARTGHTTADALEHLRCSEIFPADVVVTALGVNDVVSQVPPRRWLRELDQLHTLLQARAGRPRYTLHSAVPPMHSFPLLPQPLRWLMGAQALRMNRALGRALMLQPQRGMQALPAHLHGKAAARLMACDGFHPNPAGYAAWAEALAERIVREWLNSH